MGVLPALDAASPLTGEHRAVVVIPAFNEEASVGAVVRGVRAALPRATILVVDDGSADRTADAGRAAGAQVLRLPFNCGIGVAVQAGLRLAAAAGAQLVVRLDGDGQHDPADVHKLVAAVEGGADYAVGSRFLSGAGDGYGSSLLRRLGIRWFTGLLRFARVGTVTDPTSGFFAANGQAARFLATCCASDYPEVDAVVRLARSGFRVTEAPVAMRDRTGGTSSIGTLAAVAYMVKVTAAILVSWLDTRPGRRARAS